MKILFLNGFTEAELTMYREHVHYCIWRNMRTLAGRPQVQVSRRRRPQKTGIGFSRFSPRRMTPRLPRAVRG
jgi:hypothetical protein